MNSRLKEKAIAAIQNHGILLVFPIHNRPQPLSIWKCLFPRTEMRWEWDDSADNRVVQMWQMRAELSESREVVYSKWYQGRATFFSRECFVWMLSYLQTPHRPLKATLRESVTILEALKMDSPLSTKTLKEVSDLQGRDFESQYNRAMKKLWSELSIVAFGEFEDSSFPSLGIGSTEVLFEELWEEAKTLDKEEAERLLQEKLTNSPLFWKFAQKISNGINQ